MRDMSLRSKINLTLLQRRSSPKITRQLIINQVICLLQTITHCFYCMYVVLLMLDIMYLDILSKNGI